MFECFQKAYLKCHGNYTLCYCLLMGLGSLLNSKHNNSFCSSVNTVDAFCTKLEKKNSSSIFYKLYEIKISTIQAPEIIEKHKHLAPYHLVNCTTVTYRISFVGSLTLVIILQNDKQIWQIILPLPYVCVWGLFGSTFRFP